jgi:hypothetical protein
LSRGGRLTPQQYAQPRYRVEHTGAPPDEVHPALRVPGRPRIQPGSARHNPGLRRDDWYAVVDRNPAALLALEAQPAASGYFWLFVQDGRGLHVKAAHFDVELDADGEKGRGS